MDPLVLSPPVRDAIFAEAESAWPREACGVVVGPRDEPSAQRFVRFDNEQDRLHAVDPERHPRDARTAYHMNPLKLQRLVDAVEAEGEALVAIVHSHPEHAAYFSEMDVAAAAPFGTPTHPHATQVVVSVIGREVRDVKGFAWSGEAWVERPLG